ncbi:hypothetical protein V2J09_020807 [Rumex salicifolius]
MASNRSSSVALFFMLNLLFFTLVVSGCDTCPGKVPKPKPSPSSPGSSSGTCPRDALKLGVCANVLTGLLNLNLGQPPKEPCCSLIGGLVDLEAAVCLCTAIKADILGIHLNVPVSLSLLLNYCGYKVPPKMASNKSSSVALFFMLNLLFFTLVVSGCNTCPGTVPKPKPKPKPSPSSPSTSSGTCPRDALKLGVCANVLNGLFNLSLGKPPKEPCCSLIGGLVDLEAAVCLCTAIKADILVIHLNVPVSLSLLLNYCGYKVPRGFHQLKLFHLSFADDLILLCKGDLRSVTDLKNLLDSFGDISGLRVYLSKNNIYFGGNYNRWKESILRDTNFSKRIIPLNYLGVPIGSCKPKNSDFAPIIEKMTNRIHSWTARHLSYATHLSDSWTWKNPIRVRDSLLLHDEPQYLLPLLVTLVSKFCSSAAYDQFRDMGDQSSLVALFFTLNLLFFSLVVSGCDSCPGSIPKPKPSPSSPGSSSGTCPRDALKLGVCANVLGGLLNLNLGKPPKEPCCSLIDGLVDLEAAVCLCTAIKADILGIHLNVPVSLSLLLNYCGYKVPRGFQCA